MVARRGDAALAAGSLRKGILRFGPFEEWLEPLTEVRAGVREIVLDAGWNLRVLLAGEVARLHEIVEAGRQRRTADVAERVFDLAAVAGSTRRGRCSHS